MAITELGKFGERADEGPPRDVLATDVDGRLVVPVDLSSPAPAQPGTDWWAPDRPEVTVKRRGTPPEWLPLALAIVGWPVWWALGLSQMVFIVAAIPLAWALKKRGGIRYPPGFGIWVLFLVLVLLSGFALNEEALGTLSSSGPGRYFAFGLRFANYLALTVIMLYIGNTSERLLPRARVVRWLGSLGVAAIGLGLLSIALPNLEWQSPMAAVLPEFLSDGRVNRLAQVQPVLGDPTPRPAAPFAFTNAWGNNTSLLLIWVLVAWGVLGSRRRRIALAFLMLLAALPIIYSLNRGMWIGLLLALLVAAIRLAVRGRTLMLTASVAVVILASVVFVLSPLKTLVDQRLEAGHSNDVRGSLLETSIQTAEQSPVLGFGSTRDTQGSDASIAIGPTDDCPRCGSRAIGSTGQFTLLLIAQGFVGLALYIGYLLRTLFAFRSDHSPLGIAGTLVIAMELFYGMFYSALVMPLAIVFCAIGLLWRNDQIRRDAAGGR